MFLKSSVIWYNKNINRKVDDIVNSISTGEIIEQYLDNKLLVSKGVNYGMYGMWSES